MHSAVLLVDFRPVEGVAEFNSSVDVCVYVCDGDLKRNASLSFNFLDRTAQCTYSIVSYSDMHGLTNTVDLNLLYNYRLVYN